MKSFYLLVLSGILNLLLTASIAGADPGFEGSTIRLTVDCPAIGEIISGPYDEVVGDNIEGSITGLLKKLKGR